MSTKYVFFAWLELPYFIGIHYETAYPATFKPGIKVELHIRFRNDLLKVKTPNHWVNTEYNASQPQVTFKPPGNEAVRIPRYITQGDLSTVTELAKSANVPYLHVEQLETVIELRTEFELSETNDQATPLYGIKPELLPDVMFFNQQVLPVIAAAVDAYRVATLPAVRYSIHPISEGLVGTAFIEIQDSTGRIIQQIDYGFDLHGHHNNQLMQRHVERLGVQERFDTALKAPLTCQFEIQFCSAYYLFHMRRWTEAITIASGVVDQLLKQTVFSNLDDRIAEAIWSSYRTRTEDLFNRILPGLDLPKLSDSDQTMWVAFQKAKKYRGSTVHGTAGSSFDCDEEKSVREYLIALYNVARWLSLQNGRAWALDVTENGNLLPFF